MTTTEADSELEQLATANRARLKGSKRIEPHYGYVLPAGATGMPKAVLDANRAAVKRIAEHAQAATEKAAADRALRGAADRDRRAIDDALAAGDDPPESTEPARRRDAEIAERRRMLAHERAWHAIFELEDAMTAARASTWPSEQRERLTEQGAVLQAKRQEIALLNAAVDAEESQLGVEFAALGQIERADGPAIKGPPRHRRDHE